ncbi:MAG TPA: hypothetical protein VGC95_01615, partial [Chitinophagaceae bacterium]
ISKAVFFPPPQPAAVEKKQVAQPNNPDTHSDKVQATADQGSSSASHDERPGPDEGSKTTGKNDNKLVHRDEVGKSLSQKVNSALFQSSPVITKKSDEFKAFASEGSLLRDQSNDGENETDRSGKSIKRFNDNAVSGSVGKGKQK